MSTPPFPSAIGRYAVLDRIGRGGMGVVYRASDPHIGRPVAIKVLHGTDEALRARFLKEVQFLGTLNHPNIVTIYDSGEHGDQPFIVMEYVDGVTLAEYIRGQNPPSVPTKLKLLRELCSALDYAHQRAIVHRDVKPANLMVDRDGALKVLDFGVARIGDTQATQAGTVVGTINYMSPEQIEGRTVDKRSDIFSVGLVMYEVFALRQAFASDGKTIWQMMQSVLREKPPALSDLCPQLDADVERIVNRAIEKNPSDRYQTLALLSKDLAKIESRLPTVSLSEDATVWLRIPSLAPVPQAVHQPTHEAAPDAPAEPKVEEVASAIGPSEGVLSEEVLSDEVVSSDLSEESLSDEVLSEEALSEQVLSGEAPSQEVPGQEVPSQVAPRQDVPSQVVPRQEVPSQVVPRQEVPSQVLPRQEVPSQVVPRQEVPSQVVPRQEVPSQEIPRQEVPSQVAPRPELPSQVALRTEAPGAVAPGDAVPEPPPQITSAGGRPSTVSPAAVPKLEPARAGPSNTRYLLPLAGVLVLAAGLVLILRGPLGSFLGFGRSGPSPTVTENGPVSGAPTQPNLTAPADGPAGASAGQQNPGSDAPAQGDAEAAAGRQSRGGSTGRQAGGRNSSQEGPRRSLYDQAVGYLPTQSNPNDPAKAADLFQQACDSRDFRGCSDLAQMLETGRGIPRDAPRAASLYQRACDGGAGPSCNLLGHMYREGRGVGQDLARSATLFDRGCNNGSPDGCNNLGGQYARGVGVAKDDAKAATLYQRACDAGVPGACADLGRAYEEGRGVARDLVRARSLLQKACEGGRSPACNDLGVLYLRGEGGDKDEPRAVQFFQRACDGGASDGCYALGVAYSSGLGVERDAQLAQAAYVRACELGLTAGCDTVAQRFQRGRSGRGEAAAPETAGAGGARAGQRATRTDERPVRVGGSTAPTKIRDAPPVYPPAARAARIEGVVILEVTINSSGKVVATKILKSIPMLDAAAEQTVRQWEFAPTVINGVGRAVVTAVAVNFSLQ